MSNPTIKKRLQFHFNNTSASSKNKLIVSPPMGYDVTFKLENDDTSINMPAELQLAAKNRQVMAIAYSPGKSLFSTAFMLWMSGSGVHIFNIMVTGMALINPVKAILGTNDAFKGFGKSATSSDEGNKEDGGSGTATAAISAEAEEEGHVDLRLPKLIYISIQLIALAMGLYKCSTMGLLPLTSADWTSYIPQPIYTEHAVVPL